MGRFRETSTLLRFEGFCCILTTLLPWLILVPKIAPFGEDLQRSKGKLKVCSPKPWLFEGSQMDLRGQSWWLHTFCSRGHTQPSSSPKSLHPALPCMDRVGELLSLAFCFPKFCNSLLSFLHLEKWDQGHAAPHSSDLHNPEPWGSRDALSLALSIPAERNRPGWVTFSRIIDSGKGWRDNSTNGWSSR